jgi:hypothetical protein
MAIPEWDINGILPPISPGESGHSMNRSPYRTALIDVVENFSRSPERKRILMGLLDYRAALHEVGLKNGFQWLDGSFMEAVEIIEIRSPRDVDVVTFFYLPEQVDQNSLIQEHPHLFEPEKAKQRFLVDAYMLRLGTPSQQSFVKRVSYWYSMWSHTRAGVWKGFVEVDLSPGEDLACRDFLKTLNDKGDEEWI